MDIFSKRNSLLYWSGVFLILFVFCINGNAQAKKRKITNKSSKTTSNRPSNSDPYGHLKPISNGIFGMIPVNAFNAEWVLWENLTNKTLSKEICERHRAIFRQEAEKLIGKVIPTEATADSKVTIIEPFKIVGYEIGPDNISIIPFIVIRAKIDVDPSVGRRRLALISSGEGSMDLQISSYGTMWGDNNDKTVFQRLAFIDTHAGIWSRINKITIVKGNTQDAEMKKAVDVMLANDLRRMHQARKGKYAFSVIPEEPKETEPECFKFITVAHELLASKYSQDPPVFKKYGIGPCKHTPKHRGAGSVGIDKTWSSICFEDNHSIDVRIYKDASTGGIETVIYGQVGKLSGKREELYHHKCNLEGDLRSALYSYKGKAKSSLNNYYEVDLYSNGKYIVEIGKNRSFIAFNKIKNTPPKTEQTATKKKEEKKLYVRKTWSQNTWPGRIRKNPNNNAIETGKIYAGETFVIINEQDGWSQIDVGNNRTGWIKSDEIKTTDKITPSSAPNKAKTSENPLGGFSMTDGFNAIEFAHKMFVTDDFDIIRDYILSTTSLSFKIDYENKKFLSADRTEGMKERFWMGRENQNNPSLQDLSITVSKWTDDNISEKLKELGYTENSSKENTFMGVKTITRIYLDSTASMKVLLEITNRNNKVKKEIKFTKNK